jgi:hypothetical protein
VVAINCALNKVPMLTHRPAMAPFTGGRSGSTRAHISSLSNAIRVIAAAFRLNGAQHWRRALVQRSPVREFGRSGLRRKP